MEDFSSCFFHKISLLSATRLTLTYFCPCVNLKASLLTHIVGICSLAAYVNHEVTITFVSPKGL